MSLMTYEVNKRIISRVQCHLKTTNVNVDLDDSGVVNIPRTHKKSVEKSQIRTCSNFNYHEPTEYANSH